MFMCVCVCEFVCVHVRAFVSKRGRESERDREAAVGEWVGGGGGALQTNCRQKSNFIYY